MTTIAGTGIAGFADGTCDRASFNYPAGITVDGKGNIFVADRKNHRIRIISDGKLQKNKMKGLKNDFKQSLYSPMSLQEL